MTDVRLLSLDPCGYYPDGSPRYRFATSFPSSGVRATSTTYCNPEVAWREAILIVRGYQMLDRMGNMGEVLGVVAVYDGPKHRLVGYKGVYNLYHSNT